MFAVANDNASSEWLCYLYDIYSKLNSCEFEIIAQDDEMYKGVADTFYDIYFRYHPYGIYRPNKRTLMFAYSADAHLNLEQIRVIY